MEADWIVQGVPSKSLVESWPLSYSESAKSSSHSGVASLTGDGHYLYVHGSFGLVKVGTGYGHTIKVRHTKMVEVDFILYYYH